MTQSIATYNSVLRERYLDKNPPKPVKRRTHPSFSAARIRATGKDPLYAPTIRVGGKR